MTGRIRVIALDGFKTAIDEHIHFESPLKEYMTYAFPRKGYTAFTDIRRASLTMNPYSLDAMLDVAADCGLKEERESDFSYAAQRHDFLLNAHLHPDTYGRNAHVNVIKAFAQEKEMILTVISDLAEPFGHVVDHCLGDIEPRFYSYEAGVTKQDNGELFEYCAKQLGVDIGEIAYVGNAVHADYLVPKKMGIKSFLYVPDEKAYVRRYGDYDLTTYRSDIVNTLPQVFDKLKRRGYQLD